MAIKFYFVPVAQSVAQLIIDIKKGKVNGSNILQYARQFFVVPLTLPVNPEQIELTTNSNNKKTEVVKLGQIVIPKGVELSSLTIESFFPAKTNYEPPYLIKQMIPLFDSFTPEMFYMYFDNLQKAQVPVRLIVTECGIVMDMYIESISKKYVTCDGDLHYTLNLIEHKNYSALKLISIIKTAVDVVTSVKKVVAAAPDRQKKGLAIGDTVIVNGKYFYDSFGAGPSNTFTNFKGKISHIASNSKATHKYHITTTDGKYRGWVKQDQIQGVE